MNTKLSAVSDKCMGLRGLYRNDTQPLPASRYSHSVNQPVIQPDPQGLYSRSTPSQRQGHQ